MTTEHDAHKQPLSDAEIDLSDLWLQQNSLTVNINEIKQQAISQTRKQRFYILIDILSLTPLILFLFIDIKLSPILKGFLGINFFAAFVTATYFIKLRWVSAFGNAATIEEYKSSLLKQLKNNAKIAYLNKHMCWVVALAICVLLLLSGWFEVWTIEQTLKKTVVSLGMVTALLVPWYFWANKRQKRFENEVVDFEKNNYEAS